MFPLLLLAFLTATDPRCSVSGTVVDAVTGNGLAKVDVTLEPADRVAQHVAVAVSDAEGRFSLVDLDCADYRLRGRRARYLEARRMPVRLDPGQQVRGLTYKLVASGAIAGTVRDGEGEPAAGVHMILARRSFESGRMELKGTETTETDEDGNYRFGSLRPGAYYVVAEPSARVWDQVDHSPSPAKRPWQPILTVYPSARDASTASPIVLTAGRRVSGADIALQRSPVFQVRGTVVGSQSPTAIVLRSEAETALRDFTPAVVVRGSAFTFNNVPPGSYYVSTEGSAVPVTVSGSDVDGVRIVPGSGATVSGSIRVEGDEAREVSGRVHLWTAVTGGLPCQIRRGGFFSLGGVPKGNYRMDVRAQNANGLYVKSIRWGGVDVLRDGLPLDGAAAATVEIVMAPAGQMTGVVTTGRGAPAPGATLVLTPGLKSAVADHQGRFTLGGLAPGEYRVYAWEEVEEDAWLDPEFLKLYESRAVRLTFAAAEHKIGQVQTLAPIR